MYTDTRDGYQTKSCTIRTKKMRSYTKRPFEWKERIRRDFSSNWTNSGHDDKEAVRNVNRSHKKAYRQQLKKDLMKQIQEVFVDD